MYLIDADGVICDFFESFSTLYEEYSGQKVPDHSGWDFISVLQDTPSVVRVWDDARLFGARMRALPGALAGLTALANADLDFRIVTSVPVRHIEQRMIWFQKRLSFIQPWHFIFVPEGARNKALIDGDTLVEDHVDTLRLWCMAHPLKLGVAIRQKWNAGAIWNDVYNAVFFKSFADFCEDVITRRHLQDVREKQMQLLEFE